jgi:hypothetical protein
MFSLWQGTIPCGKTDSKENWLWFVLKDDVWKDHEKLVADTTPYIPGSFDHTLWNPAEKINSGYKVWEFLLYFYGLHPWLFLQHSTQQILETLLQACSRNLDFNTGGNFPDEAVCCSQHDHCKASIA